MNIGKSKLEIRLVVPNDAAAISNVLAEAFAEYELLYTKEGYAATTPKNGVIKKRFKEGKTWIILLDEKSPGQFPSFPKAMLYTFAVWRFCRRRVAIESLKSC